MPEGETRQQRIHKKKTPPLFHRPLCPDAAPPLSIRAADMVRRPLHYKALSEFWKIRENVKKVKKVVTDAILKTSLLISGAEKIEKKSEFPVFWPLKVTFSEFWRKFTAETPIIRAQEEKSEKCE